MRDKNEITLFIPRLMLEERMQETRTQEECSTCVAEAAEAMPVPRVATAMLLVGAGRTDVVGLGLVWRPQPQGSEAQLWQGAAKQAHHLERKGLPATQLLSRTKRVYRVGYRS